jgi:hypothetical protein
MTFGYLPSGAANFHVHGWHNNYHDPFHDLYQKHHEYPKQQPDEMFF